MDDSASGQAPSLVTVTFWRLEVVEQLEIDGLASISW